MVARWDRWLESALPCGRRWSSRALYAACGAQVTVVDLSPAMLEHDRIVAEERKLSLRTIEASMDNLSMLGDGEFDLVIHPVSTCYLPRVDRVFQEVVARVTRGGGLYIANISNPQTYKPRSKPIPASM